MSVTIKDIARDTGLSLATVSKYLNHKNISPQNRQLIEESIRRLHYVPNRTAQGLRSKTSHCICIFMPDIHDHHFGYECNYIVEYLKAKNYSSIVRSYCQTDKDSETDLLFLENRQIDGVILFAYTACPPALLSALSKQQIPFVCMHQKPETSADFVGCNDFHAGYQAARFLYERGHRQLAVMGLDSYSSHRRIEGLQAFLKEQSLSLNELYISLRPVTQPLETDCFHALSSRYPSIHAVISLEHMTTMGLLGDFTEYARSPKAYISLLAFDDDDILSSITPALTVFAQNPKRLGQNAASLLLKRMKGDFSSFPDCLLTDPVFIERESVKPTSKAQI